MAERRGSRRGKDGGEFTVDVDLRSDRAPALPAPTQPAITYRGQRVTPSMILELWRKAMAAKKRSRSRILACRALRRKDPASKVKVSAAWRRKFPEAAAVANLTIEERVTLERNLIAAVGAVEPQYEREPLGFRDTDREHAEECQSFLEEWRLRSVPAPAFAGKGVEDGEFALTQWPCDLDLEGCPDYFEYLDEAAYRDLPDDDEKARYSPDDQDKRGRYVRRDKDGKRVPRESYRKLLDEPDDDKKKRPSEREKARDARHEAARAQHDEDVAQYILRKQLDASAIRIIPALDCAPVFKRGRRRERWELVALVERALYEPWELLDAKDGYRWVGMGDRRLVPQGYRDDGSAYSIPENEIGQGGQVYVYTAYLPVKDKEGLTHVLKCTTIGGSGTWDAVSGDENDENSVSVIDLYEEYGIEGEHGGLWPFVSYHFGLRLEDDDPDQYGQPYMWALADRIKAIEETTAAMRVAVKQIAFTGHFHTPDPRWASTEDGIEAILDTAGDLRRARMPGPGEIEESSGPITPAQQAQIGQDAWRLLQMDREALAAATAVDQIPSGSSQSGHQLLVQASLGQVAKRHNRECVEGAGVACGEAFLRICYGIYQKYKIRWPLRTVQERPVRGEGREGRAPAMFDPAWVQDSQFNVAMSWPNEENLARQDLAASMYERGLAPFEDVQKERGKRDSEGERLKIDRDRLLRLPAADALRMQRVARKIGDRELLAIADLQAQQLMAPDTPGIPGGVPQAAVTRPGAGTDTASSVRGGVEGATMRGDQMAADAQAAIQGSAA